MENERHKGRFVSKIAKKKSLFLNKFNVSKSDYKCVPERRIIDIRYFGDKFDGGCRKCNGRFLFGDVINEKINGLCSVIVFKCSKCGYETSIATSRASKETSTKFEKSPYAVNMKAALGMIHAGIGETHVNGFLGTLGIPSIPHKTLKKMERKIGKLVEGSARESCSRACEEEKAATIASPHGITECGDCQSNEKKGADSATDLPADDSSETNDQISFEEALDLLEYCEMRSCEKTPYDVTSPSADFQMTEISRSETPQIQLEPYMLHTERNSENTPIEIAEPQAFVENLHTDKNTQEKEVEIIVSQDAAWTKRGRGMNSLSGWGHVIGVKTKKCLDFATRVKNCAKCNFHQDTAGKVPPHDCRKNWTGSAKSMEPDIATNLHQNAKEYGMKFIGVVGDEDSSSIKHIRSKVNSDIRKYSDVGHLKRSLRGKLEKLQKQHKGLTYKIIDSFVKNFAYAVTQNRSKSENKMKQSLLAIVPHMYGNHLMCGKWCSNAGSNSTTEKHANLPKGQDLTDVSFRIELENLLAPFVSEPGKLMTVGSTQANECLNHVAWSKAPKMRNYNASESFDIRCSAGVSQFNDGISYLNTVLENCDLSPQKMKEKYIHSKDKQRQYHISYKKERHVKRRRVELKKRRLFSNTSNEIKEGTTYKRECLWSSDDLDTERIPDAIDFCPAYATLNTDELNYVFYDIETTTLGNDAEIIQLSACTSTGENFNRFSVPTGNISPQASTVTGLTLSVKNGQRVICKDGNPQQSSSVEMVLNDFIKWLGSFTGKRNILVAHNGKVFDMKILINTCIKAGCINQLQEHVYGFVDTLPIFRGITKKGLSVSLVNIYERVFGSKYSAHDSLEDSKALMRLFYNQTLEETAASSVTEFDFALKHLRNARVIQRNRSELELKLCSKNKIISKYLARKLANTGLSYHHLKLAFTRDRANGLRYLLGEKINNRPRVTDKKCIIQALNTHFETLASVE